MAEDERRNKIHAENRFYLELQQHHGGNFEAMLTTDELTIWNIFPDFHKRLFTHWRDWEWLAKSSLQAFDDSNLIARGVSKRELAWNRFNQYRRQVEACKKFMPLDELAAFLFPLIEVKADYLRQEVIQAICEGTLNPAELRKMDSIEWEQCECGNYGINIQWLGTQESDYLRQCTAVWSGYLPITQPCKSQQQREETQDRYARWQQRVDELATLNPKLSHSAICKRIATETGDHSETIRKATTKKPKPTNV